MRPESKKLLKDALDACDAIVRFVDGLTLDTYRANQLVRSAVERQFEIVGEALNQLTRRDPGVVSRIPDHGRIVSFRHMLIHGYAVVDDRIVWGIIEGNLPGLRDVLRALLAE